MKIDRFPNLEFIDLPQRSPEWFAARRGSIGGSDFKTAVAKGRGKSPSKTRTDLLEKKAIEEYTGVPIDDFVQTRPMRLGTELEPVARELLRSKTGLSCATTGMIKNEVFPGFHLSPDGVDFNKIWIVGTEIKCPTAKVHAGYMEEAIDPVWTRPAAYRHQINHYFVILGAEKVVFFSYCPKERALDELPTTSGFEWFNEESEWTEFILRFVPRPSAAELDAHVKGMRLWYVDYKNTLNKAKQLVANRKKEQKKKESAISSAALRVAELNNDLIERIS